MENKKINISFVNYFPGYKYNPSLRTPDIFSRILPKTDYDIVVNYSQPDIIISDKKICPTKTRPEGRIRVSYIGIYGKLDW